MAPVVLLLNDRTIILYGNRVEYESPTKWESRRIEHRIYAEIVAGTTEHKTKNMSLNKMNKKNLTKNWDKLRCPE